MLCILSKAGILGQHLITQVSLHIYNRLDVKGVVALVLCDDDIDLSFVAFGVDRGLHATVPIEKAASLFSTPGLYTLM